MLMAVEPLKKLRILGDLIPKRKSVRMRTINMLICFFGFVSILP